MKPPKLPPAWRACWVSEIVLAGGVGVGGSTPDGGNVPVVGLNGGAKRSASVVGAGGVAGFVVDDVLAVGVALGVAGVVGAALVAVGVVFAEESGAPEGLTRTV